MHSGSLSRHRVDILHLRPHLPVAPPRQGGWDSGAQPGFPQRPSLPQQHWDAFCREFTPLWQVTADGVWLDVSGSGRLWGQGPAGAQRLCSRALDFGDLLGAGQGPSPLVAQLASWFSMRFRDRGVFVVSAGCASAFLAPFPVHFLPTSRSRRDRLRQLGVRTLGDLQLVPASLLRGVFGKEAEMWPGLASGQAQGLDPGTGREADRGTLLMGARLQRPSAAPAHRRALLDGMAVRALAVCPGGPAARSFWRLEIRLMGGRVLQARRTSSAPALLDGWRSLLNSLDQGLDCGRLALAGMELWAGLPREAGQQDFLFPHDRRQCSLARVLAGINGAAHPRVVLANQAALEDRGVNWYGPSLGVDAGRLGK